MIFIDTHAHLYAEEFDSDRQEVMERAALAGVECILLPDVDAGERDALMSMASQYDNCLPMLGLHPTSVNDNPAWREELQYIENQLRENPTRYCAVGEMGFDLYWSREFEAEQKEAFERQIELALQYNLPVAIHAREAWDLTIDTLAQYKGRGLRGVIHAFTGEIEHYEQICQMGDFMFGIGGVVTFKKSKLAAVVASMKLEHIVLETDAPYLTPTPHRGKRNESSYIPIIASCVADLHAVSVEHVADVTTSNAKALFGIKL